MARDEYLNNHGTNDGVATPQFKSGQTVLFIPKDSNGNIYKVEPGIVKRQQGPIVFVWFHDGCTAASVRAEQLRESTTTLEHTRIHHGCSECVPAISPQEILEMLRREA